jgi:post-segregation antitoxin (ccd killing protein)
MPLLQTAAMRGDEDLRARAAGVNVSGVTQDAIRTALAASDTDAWLRRLELLPRMARARTEVELIS